MSQQVEKVTQDIAKLVAEQMPVMAGEVFQGLLAQAKEDAAQVKKLGEKNSSLSRELSAERQQVEVLQAQLSKHKALAEREAAVETRERNQEINDLKVKLAAAEGNANFARETTKLLVRNTDYRQSVYVEANNQVPGGVVQGANGMSGYSSTVPETKRETTTTTKTTE